MDWQGKVGHAELALGGGHVMPADEVPDMDIRGPGSRGGTTVSLLLYVEDMDAAHAKALAEGAVEMQPPGDKPWGDRACQLRDPFGHVWALATRVEDVPRDELDRRMAAMAR